MLRNAAIAALAIVATAPAVSADEALARYDRVAIKPMTSSIYIATVTMTMPPFSRRGAIFSSTYYAKVFPYFFWSESGRIWIDVPEDKLLLLEQGKPLDFAGRGMSESGDERRIEGRAIPTGPSVGRITVRVYVTKRIHLTFDTTYELQGASPPTAVTPR